MSTIASLRRFRISQLAKLFWCAAPALLCTVLAAQTSGFVSFDAPDAGTGTPNQGTFAVDINENHVVGGFYVDSTTSHGFIRSGNGVLTEFDVPGSSYTSGAAVGPNGQVVGTFLRPGDSHSHGFLRTPSGQFISIDVPGAADTEAGMIDASGEIIGIFDTASAGVWHGFIRHTNGVYQRFDDPNAGTGSSEGTFPSAVNANGEIAGSSKKNTTYQGFIRDSSGNFTAVKAPGAGSVGTFLNTINSTGETAGSYLDINLIQHSFLRNVAGNMTIIDDPAATNTGAVEINDFGTVIGIIRKGALTASFERDSLGIFSPILIPVPNAGVSVNRIARTDTTIVGSYLDSSNVSHGFIKQ